MLVTINKTANRKCSLLLKTGFTYCKIYFSKTYVVLVRHDCRDTYLALDGFTNPGATDG